MQNIQPLMRDGCLVAVSSWSNRATPTGVVLTFDAGVGPTNRYVEHLKCKVVAECDESSFGDDLGLEVPSWFKKER